MKKVLLSALALSAVAASQAIVVISEDFDQAQYVVGNTIVGVLLTSQPTIPWALSSATTTGWKTNNNRALSGTKSVHVTGTAGTWAWPNGSPTISAGEIWTASVNVFVGQAGNGATQRFGLDIWGNTNMDGGLAVRADGSVWKRSGAAWGQALAAGTAPAGQWHNIKLEMTYATATTGTVKSFLNGNQVGGSVAITEAFSDVDMYAGLRTAGTDASFDNYKLEVVPEPATMAALGLGLAAMARRRKSK
jgi:hypothetical protein